MKYCPQCRKQYTEAWVSFCSDDGTTLIEEFSPPPDPNWDPRIRPTQVESPSEQATQWLPPQTASPPSPSPRAWVAPDERPLNIPAWQPPPSPNYVRPPSQGLAIASMITGVLGLLVGTFCLGPLPGIVALVLGLVALSQIKKDPLRVGGKPLAIIGVATGSLSIVVYGLLFILFLLGAIISN